MIFYTILTGVIETCKFSPPLLKDSKDFAFVHAAPLQKNNSNLNKMYDIFVITAFEIIHVK